MTYTIEIEESFISMLHHEQDWWYANREKNISALDDDFEKLLEKLPHHP